MVRRHVILVGLSGAGKTTAGRIAAGMLKAPFRDVDEHIGAVAGKSIPRIFADDGEAAFRVLERRHGLAALDAPPAVISTGGGFYADDALRAASKAAGLVLYLRTNPVTAARRLDGDTTRPLLDSADRGATLATILAARETFYVDGTIEVTTDDHTADEVAAEIAKLARSQGGW